MWWVVAHGWNIDERAFLVLLVSVPAGSHVPLRGLVWVVVEHHGWDLGGLSSTLLGPQVTGHRLVGCLVRAGPWTTNRFVCALV